MAQSFTTDAGVLLIPGAYPQVTVQNASGGLATTGVIMLVGEADAGPDFSLESDITQNGFGPDQLAAVLAKYKSGPVVDGFRACAVAANDPQIQGAPTKIFIVKSNASVKASASLARAGLSAYATLADRSWGALGNNLYAAVTDAAAEVAPSTGPTTWIPTPSGATMALRVNGGAVLSAAITALVKPTTSVGAITSSATGLQSLATSGVMVLGGVDRSVLTGLSATSNLAISVSGNNVTVTLSGAGTTWGTIPSVGDTLLIPGSASDYGASAGSVIKGAASANAGAYVVTSASALVINATKLRNDLAGALTPPVAVGAVAISATPTNDLIVCSPVTISNQTGTSRALLAAGNVGVNVTGTLVSGNLIITLASGTWNTTPAVNDFVLIPATAPAAIANADGGWFTVVSATSTVLTLSRVSTDRVAATFGATALAATTDIQVYRPSIDGVGKTLEIQDNAGTDNISTLFYALSATPVTWISTTGTPVIQRSATERKATMNVQRNSDSVNEVISAGGDLVLKLGYQGTTATVTVTSTTLSTTVTGGTGANLSITLSSLKTVGDLVAKIASNTGYTCSANTSLMSQLPVTVLDQVTALGIASTQAVAVAAIKKDAYEFNRQVTLSSSTVQLGTSATLGSVQAASGLPEVQATTFLSAGARGPTTGAKATAAIDACEKIKGNFLVTLFSRDASADVTDGLTDSASTYTVDGTNAYVVTHCNKMSTLKRRRPRQGFVSKRDSFLNAKLGAANLAAARVSFYFQDVKAVGLDGSVAQYQPWYAACLAAGMQAAGFYRPIFNKGVNCSGILQNAGDFSDADTTQLEDALQAGCGLLSKRDLGGFQFVSDQTTYTADSNFVYNSVQAVYVADTIAQTIAQRLEKAFVGQSFADLSAALVVSFIKGIIADLRRLKLVTASDDAPEGYANLKVDILAPAIAVSLSLVEATGVYFIPIKALIQQVKQSATG